MSRRAAIIAAVALAVLMAACDSTGSSPSPSTTPSPKAVSWLFSITSDRGTLEATGDGGHLLRLTGVDKHTIAFADRPNRDVNVIATGDFVASWDKMFADFPPNAVLVEHRPDGRTDSLVLVLSHPAYDAEAATLTYAATVTADEHPERVAELVGEAHSEVPTSFLEASLFIDDVVTYYTLDNWPTDPNAFAGPRFVPGMPIATVWQGGIRYPNQDGVGSFYLATVTNYEESPEELTVAFADDGTVGQYQPPQPSVVRFIPATTLAVGDRVLAVWSTKARFYPGAITAVDGLMYTVKWDDGSPPSQVPLGKIILE